MPHQPDAQRHGSPKEGFNSDADLGPNPSDSPVSVRWTPLVEGARDGDSAAIEELYRLLARGIRFFFCRHLGPQELDDRVHDTFLMIVRSIQNGGLREPERLMGFVRTIVRRQIAAYIEESVLARRESAELEVTNKVADHRHDPEQRLLREQRVQLMLQVLRSISPRDREILTRFYLYEQTQEQICQEMGLTETQFRLLKSRAKSRLAELGRRRLIASPVLRILRRDAKA